MFTYSFYPRRSQKRKKTIKSSVSFCVFGICERKKLLVKSWWNRSQMTFTSPFVPMIGEIDVWCRSYDLPHEHVALDRIQTHIEQRKICWENKRVFCFFKMIIVSAFSLIRLNPINHRAHKNNLTNYFREKNRTVHGEAIKGKNNGKCNLSLKIIFVSGLSLQQLL